MEEIIIIPVIFIIFYMIIELFVHRKERLMIIEKASQNQSFDVGGMLKNAKPAFSFTGLKIGCLLLGLGVGFFASFGLRLVLYNWIQRGSVIDVVDIASVLTFGGLGLIVAYLIEKAGLSDAIKKHINKD